MTDDETNGEQEENQKSMDSIMNRDYDDQGFWKEMWHQIRLAWLLIRSPDVPWYLKLLPALAVIYILIPTDLIPDVFPVIGQLDDITALIVGAKVFIELSPQDVVNRHVMKLRQRKASTDSDSDSIEQQGESLEDSIVIEGDFQFVEEENENRAD